MVVSQSLIIIDLYLLLPLSEAKSEIPDQNNLQILSRLNTESSKLEPTMGAVNSPSYKTR